MDVKEMLLETARGLPRLLEAAREEYASQRERVVADTIGALEEREDLDALTGGNGQMMRDNERNHARFMEALFAHFAPETLVEGSIWAYKAYRSHGFSRTYFSAVFEARRVVLEQRLSTGAYKAIEPYYSWFVSSVPLLEQAGAPQSANLDR
jgi:GNAT superfamily N-acetyltransferase